MSPIFPSISFSIRMNVYGKTPFKRCRPTDGEWEGEVRKLKTQTIAIAAIKRRSNEVD